MLTRRWFGFWYMPLVFVLELVALAPPSQAADGANQAPPAQNLVVKDCSPCLLKIRAGGGDFELRFKVRNLDDGTKVIEDLVVSANGSAKQTMPVHDMTPLEPSSNFFVGTADINFDGFNDLFVITSQGVANSYADYWQFLPASAIFSYLGNYPVFAVDGKNQQLSTYERGGFGGMEFEKKQYKFINGQLVVIASEKQEPTGRQGTFRKIFMQRKGGKLREVKREVVRVGD